MLEDELQQLEEGLAAEAARVQDVFEQGVEGAKKQGELAAGKVVQAAEEAGRRAKGTVSHLKRLKEAPVWAKSLWKTDWVSLALMAPIIAGLVVYVVYLWQAQNNYEQILDLIDASGGLSAWISAYAVFLAVTLPLVVLSLAYVLGMMLASTLKKWKVRRDADALSGEAITPRGYKWYRAMLLVLMGLQYLGIIWLIAQLVATFILLVTSYGLDAAAGATTNFYDDIATTYSTQLDNVKELNATLNQAWNSAYNTTVNINGTEVNVGTYMSSLSMQVFNTTLRSKRPVTNTTVCPDFCINLAWMQRMLSLDMESTCICSPDAVQEIGQLAHESEGLLISACIGIILMIAAWVILLMRLAANYDMIRVKFKLQGWLLSERTPPTTPASSTAHLEEGLDGRDPISAADAETGLADSGAHGADTHKKTGHWWKIRALRWRAKPAEAE